MIRLLFVLAFFSPVAARGAQPFKDICLEWFEAASIHPGTSCVFDCVFTKVTSDTQGCELFCPDICDHEFGGAPFFIVTGLYPGLTLAERAMATAMPYDSLRAYAYSWQAERRCMSIYGATSTNDESDACRHYLWAGIMTCRFGKDKAQKFLDAHETAEDQPEEERAMDLANNRAGILGGIRMIESGDCIAQDDWLMNIIRILRQRGWLY